MRLPSNKNCLRLVSPANALVAMYDISLCCIISISNDCSPLNVVELIAVMWFTDKERVLKLVSLANASLAIYDMSFQSISNSSKLCNSSNTVEVIIVIWLNHKVR